MSLPTHSTLSPAGNRFGNTIKPAPRSLWVGFRVELRGSSDAPAVEPPRRHRDAILRATDGCWSLPSRKSARVGSTSTRALASRRDPIDFRTSRSASTVSRRTTSRVAGSFPRARRAGKVIAQLMGHAKIDTTLYVCTPVVDGSLRRAAETVGSELFTIVHNRAAAPLEGKGQGANVKGEEVVTSH